MTASTARMPAGSPEDANGRTSRASDTVSSQGSRAGMPASGSTRSLNALRKGTADYSHNAQHNSLPANMGESTYFYEAQKDARTDQAANQRYQQQQPRATSQRQASVDSINMANLNLSDEQHSGQAHDYGYRPNSRNDASTSGQQRAVPSRGASTYSTQSANGQRVSYETPLQGQPLYEGLEYAQEPGSYAGQGAGQAPYGDFDPSAYASTSAQPYVDPRHQQQYHHLEEQGYPAGSHPQDAYYQHQQQYQAAQYAQQGYADPNASTFYDPATGQYYQAPQQQYDQSSQSHHQQGYYAPPPGSQSGHYYQEGYNHAAEYGYPAEYAASSQHGAVNPQYTVSGASSYTASGSQPPLHRNRTTASTKSGASASDKDRSQPITKQAVDEYRNRIKSDPDPETQFNFARFLIEAARRLAVATQQGSVDDAKSVKKYRDALLQEALKLIKRLATQGSGLGKPAYADAQFFLANCLGHGALGLAVDHEKAYNLYVQASKQNHAAATYRTAVCNEVGAGTRRDPSRAILFYRKASALGDTAGMYKLGMILLNGLLGQPKNPREAVTWLKKAAAQADEENPHALHELGILYEKQQEFMQNGQPLPSPVVRDEAQARELFTQGAQLGHAPCQYKLASCYEYGSLTCPVDPRRSIAWYTRAAEKGHAESELALSGWYLTGSEGVLKQSDSEAYLWARRAANKGLSKAEYAVGYYSEIGIGVKADLDEAKMWYLRAAASGNRRAMQRLSELKKLGNKKAGAGARPTRQQAKDECIIC